MSVIKKIKQFQILKPIQLYSIPSPILKTQPIIKSPVVFIQNEPIKPEIEKIYFQKINNYETFSYNRHDISSSKQSKALQIYELIPPDNQTINSVANAESFNLNYVEFHNDFELKKNFNSKKFLSYEYKYKKFYPQISLCNLFLTIGFILLNWFLFFFIRLSVPLVVDKCTNSLGYEETCTDSYQCNSSIGLYCPNEPGLCNCPVPSTNIFCDCKPGHFWDYNKTSCVPAKLNTEGCVDIYQCDPTRNLICDNNECKCPLTGNWFWSSSTKRCVQCPNNWVIFSSHCYYVNTNKLSWYEAEKWCNEQGANLMKIDDDEEYNLTYDFYKTYANGGNLWIGGKAEILWDFRWSVDDSPFDRYSPYWCRNEPNNHPLGDSDIINEGCVFMWTARGNTCLNDYRCNAAEISCCEKTL